MFKKNWLKILVVVFLLILSFKIYQKISENKQTNGRSGSDRKGQKISVEFDKIQLADITQSGKFSGSLSPKNTLVISPKISGQLKRVLVNIGDKIKKNQILAVIDDRVFQQEFEKAKASLEIAEANAIQAKQAYEIAENELENQKTLLSKSYISQNEFDRFKTEYVALLAKHKVAQANVISSRASLETAKLDLAETKIKAEWEDTGSMRVVGEKFVDDGIMLNKGTSIMTLLDITKLIAVIYISEMDYSKIKVGQEALITVDSYQDKSFKGKVARIAPMLQQTSRQAKVEIEIENQDLTLKPGMYANIEITFFKKDKVKAVPYQALYKFKEKTGVFLIDQDSLTVQFIELKTGIQNNKFAEIISPDIDGEVVIIGQDLLKNGSKIQTLKSDMSLKRTKP